MGSHTKRAHARKRSATRRRSMAAGATVAVTLPVLGFLAQPAAAESDAPYDCAQGRVFVVPGTADPNSIHTKGLEQRYGKDADRLDYEIKIVDYPGVLWPLGGTSYDESVAVGKANLERDVKEYVDKCPDKPIVIVGYSQGARIAGDVLSELGREENPDITIAPEKVSGELYSDPRRTGNATGRGIELTLPGVLPGITLMGEREGFGGATVTQFCVEGDPICDLQDPLRYPFRAIDGLLGYFVKHLTYDDDITAGPADVSPGSPRDVLIASDPAIGVILKSLGLPFYNIAVDNPLRYPDLAVLRPLFHAFNELVAPLPNLGHGAYLPDLWALRDALAGSPAAWQIIGGSAVSILRYPENFVRDWIAEIDRQLDQLDGARLGVAPTPTPVNATQRTVDTSTTEQVWIEPQDLPGAADVAPSFPEPPASPAPVGSDPISGPLTPEPIAVDPVEEPSASEATPSVSTSTPPSEPGPSGPRSDDDAPVDGVGSEQDTSPRTESEPAAAPDLAPAGPAAA